MGTATATPNANHNTAKSLTAASHYGLQVETGKITGSASYATGGDSITFAMGSPDLVYVQPTNGIICSWNSTAATMMTYRYVATSQLMESTAAWDMSASTALTSAPYIAFKWGGR